MEKREKLEIDIEFRDLLAEFFRKWRFIVCLAVIGGILLGAVSYVKDMKSANTPAAPIVQVTEELNVDELEEVISAVQLKAQIDAKSQYISESTLMKINPFSANCIVLEYKMDGLDAFTALNSCQTWIEQYGFLGDDISEKERIYLGELVSSGIEGETLTVQILHQSAEECEELAAVVKKALEQYANSLKLKGVSYDISLLQETTSVIVYDELHKLQATYLDECVADQEELAKMKADMNAKQVTAYLRMERKVVDNEEQTTKEKTEIITPQPAAEKKVTLNFKKVLLGMVIGAVLAMAYIFMAYLMTGKLRTVEEIEKLYDVKLLGTLQKANLSMKQKLVATSIYIQCQECGSSKVYACGSKIADVASELLENVKVELESFGIAFEVGGDIAKDADALLAASKVGTVLLVEEKRNSAYKDIYKQVQMCDNNHIRILGAVVVE